MATVSKQDGITTPGPDETPASSTYLSHMERTAEDYRDPDLHAVKLKWKGDHGSVRRLRLEAVDQERGIEFRPGQWLDVHIPDPAITRPGGFTITSDPVLALPVSVQERITEMPWCEDEKGRPDADRKPSKNAYLELAVQKSSNPPAAWLCQEDVSKIIDKTLHVRVGGSFCWPPPSRNAQNELARQPSRVVMVAGGVGINPFMSMISHFYTKHFATRHRALRQGIPTNEVVSLAGEDAPRITLLYGTKFRQDQEPLPLFMKELMQFTIHDRFPLKKFPFNFRYFTGSGAHSTDDSLYSALNSRAKLEINHRRMTLKDVELHSPTDNNAIYYVCGPKAMTDEYVEGIKGLEGVHEQDVLCEKWW